MGWSEMWVPHGGPDRIWGPRMVVLYNQPWILRADYTLEYRRVSGPDSSPTGLVIQGSWSLNYPDISKSERGPIS